MTNTVNPEDIKIGKTLFISHPVMGVMEIEVLEEPVSSKINEFGSIFTGFMCLVKNKKESFKQERMLGDCGIGSEAYDVRRTFFAKGDAQNHQKECYPKRKTGELK